MAGSKLEIFNLKEDPDRWEALIEAEITASSSDESARQTVESMYWEKDRGAAFQRFSESLDARHILDLLSLWKVPRKQPLCEIGGGSGQLAWVLAQNGYENVELLEPNGRWITGTGYLETVIDRCGGRLRICNDLASWYGSDEQFRTIVTRNCVHHFPNIAMTAACRRQKMKKGGRWVMIREWFADTPEELYMCLRGHPYCQKYKVYEFPFPASHYVDSVEFAGFKLVAVVPTGYANNALSTYSEDEGGRLRRRLTSWQRSVLKRAPWVSVFLYRVQTFLNRSLRTRFKGHARPQIMVFERTGA
jgi:hypothetical protein